VVRTPIAAAALVGDGNRVVSDADQPPLPLIRLCDGGGG
jgi:hypothetical protein